MSLLLLIFLLRVVGALLLMAFVGVMGYVLWQDMRLAVAERSPRQTVEGMLQPVEGGASFPLLAVTTIGRSPKSVVTIASDVVSAEHAVIRKRQRQWWLEDLDSRNGTRLNGAPVLSAVVLTEGDEIEVGNVTLRLSFG